MLVVFDANNRHHIAELKTHDNVKMALNTLFQEGRLDIDAFREHLD